MSNMDSNLRQRLHLNEAQKRIEKIKTFYLRLGVYCSINAILITTWAFDTTPPAYFWGPTLFFNTLVGGLLVLTNAIMLFGGKYILPQKWEERKLKEFMNHEKQTTKYE